MRQILNIDESCLSLDGSTQTRGGRPECLFFDPQFPVPGRGTSKSSVTPTLIAGSTAFREPIPPHFQSPSKATKEENEKVRANFVKYTRTIRGKFGLPEERNLPATAGCNEKGGMKEPEFKEYLEKYILPLYEDARDEPGHRVMLKVNSGPGRLLMRMLARMRVRGIYMYPAVSNKTSVLQEADCAYVPMKTGSIRT